MDEEQRQDTIKKFIRQPALAHAYFFAHRHPDLSPEFHREFITDLHNLSINKYLAVMFRGSAKSTLIEEATILLSLYRVIKNGIIVGETETRASERLQAIKHEIENNERLQEFFPNSQSEPWTATRALLSNGTYLQAYGRGQSLRGAKHLDNRPDFAFLDDIESEESVNTPEAIQKTMRWITATLFPAMAKNYRIRMAATPLHPDAACVQLAKDKSFITKRVPVYYYNPLGQQVSAWPERNPLDEMLAKKEEYERLGMAREFSQEYLCEAETNQTKAFDKTNIPLHPELIHTFHPTFITIDPARTAKSTSSLTGYAVGSWINNDLILWEADGHTIRPDDIIKLIFELNTRYNPITIGIDKTGLEEFIMSPLRNEMARRNTLLPVVPVHNPRNKLDFIRSLQPFIQAGQIKLAKPSPLLQSQLQNFPSGKIDVLNCVAYLLQMHPGEPVYQGFDSLSHILPAPMESLPRVWPVVHCLNSTSTETCGASITILRKQIVVLADCQIDGSPINAATPCLDNLRLATGFAGKIIIPKKHYQAYESIGLRAALLHSKNSPGMGTDFEKGRVELQERIETGRFSVSDTALLTLRAITGGYSYAPGSKEPKPSSYKTLMEAIECAIGCIRAQIEDQGGHYAYSSTGRKFLSSRP